MAVASLINNLLYVPLYIFLLFVKLVLLEHKLEELLELLIVKHNVAVPELTLEHSLALDDVLTINIQDYTGYNVPVADFTFSENVIDAGTGNISGSLDSNQWLVTHFSCDNNVFKAARFSSDEWWSREKYPKREWLFPVRLSDYWGKTSFHVTGNMFQAKKNGNIRLLLSKYNKEQGDGHAGTMAFRGNKCSQGSVIRICRLCTHPWGRYHPLL